MNTPTNWAPGLIVLLAALAVGIVVVWRSRRGAALPAPERTRREELERQKDTVYTLLREHNAARGDGGAEWAAERDRLELDAARVLRDLDAIGEPAPAPHAPAPSGFGARHPRLVGALWGGGVVLFLGGLALTLQEFAAPRPEGGSMTGNNPADDGAAAAPALNPAQEAQLAVLRTAAEAAPTDVAALNAYGHALLHAGKLMDSYQQAEAVVALKADDPESRTHQAIVLIAIGDAATAAKALDRVIEGAPAFGEALAYRGALHFQAGEHDQAIAVLERAVVADPRLADSVGPLIDAARKGEGPMTASASPAGGAPSGGPSGAGPMAGAGPMSGGAAASGPSAEDITGTITLDARVASAVKPGDTLFLSARPVGVTGGPPTWVKRVPVSSFPLAFTLGPANAMLGGPTPPALVITARIDRDGDAKTKSPDDLEGKTETLQPGATDVAITLAAVGT